MITPIEVRQKTFKKGFQGYNRDEVQAFLNTLSVEWEHTLDELKRTKKNLEKTSNQLDGLRQVESALHKTLLQAEETSRHTIESAKQEAETKIRNANDNAREIVQKAMDERSRIETQIRDLVVRRDQILKQLKGYLVAQTERLKTFEDKEAIEAPDLARQKASENNQVNSKSKGSSNEKPKAENPYESSHRAARADDVKVKAVEQPETQEKPLSKEPSGTKPTPNTQKEPVEMTAKKKVVEVVSEERGSNFKNEKLTDVEDNSEIRVKLSVKELSGSGKGEKSGSFFDQSVTSNEDEEYIDYIADEL